MLLADDLAALVHRLKSRIGELEGTLKASGSEADRQTIAKLMAENARLTAQLGDLQIRTETLSIWYRDELARSKALESELAGLRASR